MYSCYGGQNLVHWHYMNHPGLRQWVLAYIIDIVLGWVERHLITTCDCSTLFVM
jgi:hypothetical protein